ncbi:MAG: porin, partial [Pseudomonadota bacterium]
MKLDLSIGVLSAAFLTALTTSPAAMALEKELLDVLLANGAITQAQHEALLAKVDLDEKDIKEVVVKVDKKGLNVESEEGDYYFQIGTRLHAEASTHGDIEGASPNNGTELRRARLQTKGKFAKDWSWAAEVDFADNKTSIKDFWLGYKGASGTKYYFGNQKQPFSLALEMSSNDIPFIARSVDNNLAAAFTDRAIGFRFDKSGTNWFVSGGIFGESVSPPGTPSDEGWGVAGRFVYSPIIESDQILHLGIQAAMRDTNTGSQSIRVRDETTHLSSLRIVDTG